MTISSETRNAGPYTGNGLTTSFTFAFKVFTAADVLVVRTDLSALETVLTLSTDYTVTLNSNQDSNPGGTVVLPSALTTGFLLTLSSQVGALQATDLTNQGGFYPSVLNTALDKLTILVQQLKEQVSRSVKVDISSSITPATLTGYIVALYNNLTNISAVATNSSNINSAVANATNINTVATNNTNVTAVGVNITNVNSVAGNSTNINAVNANATNINAVNSNSTNINTVATNISSVNTVATNIASINTNTSNITAIQNASANATAAAGSATSASGSAATATTQATNAASSATSTAALLASFRSAFLGSFVSDTAAAAFATANSITLSNGIMYENNSTTPEKFRIYNGSAWQDYDASAQASQSAAALSAANAAASASTASTQATNAANSATSAATQATNAATSATAASTSASTATTQASNASTSATNSANSATAAASSATSASTSATNAASSYNTFHNQYQGAYATAPTTRPDSSALQLGDLYFNTTTNSMQVRGGSGWTNAGSSVNGTARRYRYIATAGQTTFTGSDSNGNTMAYDAGYIDVYLNGVRLDQSDYTASSGTSIVLASGAVVNDEFNIIAFGTFSVAAFDGSGLNNASVSPNKLTAGAPTWDSSGNVSINGSGVTGYKLNVNGNAGFGSDVIIIDSSNTYGYTVGLGRMISNGAGGFGGLTFQTYNGGFNNQASIDGNGVFGFNSGYGSVATAYGCRAWVNFNGTGTVAIRASGNVSSITDNGVGDYTVNFTTAMPDANYSLLCSSGQPTPSTSMDIVGRNLDYPLCTTTQVRIYLLKSTNAVVSDNPNIHIGVLR